MRCSVLFVASAVALSGCAKLNNDWSADGYGVAAPPLAMPAAPLPTTKDAVWLVVNDSEAKCVRFVNGLIAAETGTNTGLDLDTTLFSGLAATLKNTNVSHALSGAATITGGWKTAIDSDVFAQASVANYAQAIQSSYFKDIGSYGTKLAANAGTIDFGAEFAQIQSIHAECSLGSAQAAISATLKGAPPSNTPAPAPAPGPAALPPPPPPGATSTTSFVVPGHPVQTQ
jgi:hypothetical protein